MHSNAWIKDYVADHADEIPSCTLSSCYIAS